MYLLGSGGGGDVLEQGVPGAQKSSQGRCQQNELGLARQRRWARASECVKKGERKAGQGSKGRGRGRKEQELRGVRTWMPGGQIQGGKA